jgi:hypothetical protein
VAIIEKQIIRSVLQQRQPEHLQIEPAQPSSVLGIQSMPLDIVLPETPPAAAHLLLAQIENRDSPIAIGCPAANVSFVLAGGRRLVIEGPSKPSNTRRVHLLCGISESVRNSGQGFGMTNKPSPESTVRTGHSASSRPETDSLLYLAVGARATDVVLETALSSCSQPLSR